MSADWITVVVTFATGVIFTACTSRCRLLADQIAAADQRLDERIAVLSPNVHCLADLVERQCAVRAAMEPPADSTAGSGLPVATTSSRDQRSIASPGTVAALTPRPVAGTNPAQVYLGGLAESGRRGMATALSQAAAVVTQGAGSIDTTPWHLLTADHVIAIKRKMIDNGAAPATINRMLSALRGVARCAWRAGLISVEHQARITDVPLAKVRRLPRGRHVAADEIAAMLDGCDLDTPTGARDAAMLALLYGAGLRRSELVSLDLEDYDKADGTITVTGKGGHQRHVYAINGAKVVLDAWIRHRGDASGALLAPVAKGGRIQWRRLTAQSVRLRLRALAQRAGVPMFSPHDLRRSLVGELLDAGADMSAVQRLVGHASVQTTAGYDRRGDRAARRAAEMLQLPPKVV